MIKREKKNLYYFGNQNDQVISHSFSFSVFIKKLEFFAMFLFLLLL